jgi:hypothetical protein
VCYVINDMIHTAHEGWSVTAVPQFEGSDIVVTDPDQSLGLVIVGMAQAGKTKLRSIVEETWQEFAPDSPTLSFSNSNGFRGLTAAVLELGDVAGGSEVTEEDFRLMLDNYLSVYSPENDVPELLDAMYTQPAPADILRSRAVDSTVAMLSEDLRVRPLVNSAGARFLNKIIEDPTVAHLEERPGLVILDGRSADECRAKFDAAGVNAIGTFVLTCPEEIAADRGFPGASDDVVEREVRRLQERNRVDRARMLGRMTLPPDLAVSVYVYDLVTEADSRRVLVAAGMLLATAEVPAGAVFATDRVSIEQEEVAVDGLMTGMLLAVNG